MDDSYRAQCSEGNTTRTRAGFRAARLRQVANDRRREWPRSSWLPRPGTEDGRSHRSPDNSVPRDMRCSHRHSPGWVSGRIWPEPRSTSRRTLKTWPTSSSLVYIDAFVPNDGESWWELAGDRYRQLAVDRSKADGVGVVPPQHLDSRCTPHPLATFHQAIRLTGRWQEVREKVFIFAAEWPETPFASTYATLKADPAWTVRSLPTRHDIVRDAPQDLVSIVLDVKAVRASSSRSVAGPSGTR
jgi:hypothetical protein